MKLKFVRNKCFEIACASTAIVRYTSSSVLSIPPNSTTNNSFAKS